VRRPLPSRSSRARRAGLAALFAGGLTALLGAPTWANGRYPAAGLVALSPTDASRLLVRSTFGFLASEDGGATWGWICEQGVGFDSEEDPMVVFVGDTLGVGLFKGLAQSSDGGCNWAFVGGELEGRYAIDLSVDKADPQRGVVVVSNGVGPGVFDTRVFETTDGAASWHPFGEALPDDVLGLTLDLAPSQPTRLYVSGRLKGPGYEGVLERSDDGGATWQRFFVPGSDDKALPYLGAIDPSDPDRVYVRLDREPDDQVLVSDDGGATFSLFFQGSGSLLGFALSPDGGAVFVGGPDDGLVRIDTQTGASELRSERGLLCLTAHQGGLYACFDEVLEGMTVGHSSDDGATFAPALLRGELCPLVCENGSTTKSECATRWGPVALVIEASSCLGSGGAGGQGAAGGGAGGSAGGGGQPAAPGGGCCQLAGGRASEQAPRGLAAGALALALALAARLGRRWRSREGAAKPTPGGRPRCKQ
jgi:photosystem II stability/assembly factor-like uncharacterized protein